MSLGIYLFLVTQNFQLLDWWWFNLHHWSNDWKKKMIAQKHLVANFQLPNLESICPLAKKNWLCFKTILVSTQKTFVRCPENFSCPIDGGSIPTSVLMIEIFLSLPKKVQFLFEKLSIIDQKRFSITTWNFLVIDQFFYYHLKSFQSLQGLSLWPNNVNIGHC